jgi:hypothetical protein
MDNRQSDFSQMDDAGISKEHSKIVFISGMGFFTDAYDLFIIGVVMALLKPIWHVGKVEEGLVESTARLAAAIVSGLGLIVTIFMLPETKGKSLEEVSEEPSSPAERAAA